MSVKVQSLPASTPPRAGSRSRSRPAPGGRKRPAAIAHFACWWKSRSSSGCRMEIGMSRIRFDFATVTLEADLLDTPTALAIAAALPMSCSVLTWGEEVYFEVPVKAAAEKDARAVI